MEPAAFPRSEFIPLPQNNLEFQGEAKGAPGAQTIVMIQTTEPPPKDYIVWSIFHLVYCNPLCLGLAAFYYSVKARDRKVAGDVEGSRKYSSKACRHNVGALIVSVIMISLMIYSYVKAIHVIQQVIGQGLDIGRGRG